MSWLLVHLPLLLLVHFNNGSEYLTSEIIQVFILLAIFLLSDIGFAMFLVLLMYTFYTFSLIACLWLFPLPIFPILCNFLSLQVFYCFPDLIGIFILLFRFFLSFNHQHGTFSISNPIPLSWLYILLVCIIISFSFSFFTTIHKSSVYISLLISSCGLKNLFLSQHFLSILWNIIIAIKNRWGKS